MNSRALLSILTLVALLWSASASQETEEPLCRQYPERCLVTWPSSPAGWERIAEPAAEKFRIDTVVVVSRDAFDDSEIKSEADRLSLSLLNHLHWETRPKVIRRSLPFAEGDVVSGDELQEAERLLRQQNYLNDAAIELWRHSDGRHLVRVVTSDRFTLSVPISVARPDSLWNFSLGLLEYNFMGTGNELGALFSHSDERDSYLGFFRIPHFFLFDQRLEFELSQNSDGYRGAFAFYRPFTTVDTRWAWTVEGMMRRFDDRWVVDRRTPMVWETVVERETVADKNASLVTPRHSPVAADLREIEANSLSVRFSHAMGDDHFKSYLRVGWDRWNYSTPKSVDPVLLAEPFRRSDGEIDTLFGTALLPDNWWSRRDSRIGVRHTLRSFRYERVRNLRNVRWTEDLELGWTLYNGAARNFVALGAQRDEWRLEHRFRLQEGWHSRLFLTLDGATHYYLGESGVTDGWVSGLGELAYKQRAGRFSTHLQGRFESFYADNGARQLRLGALTGLGGFPTDWMVGRTMVSGSIEERWTPDFEFATVVPVMAAFYRAGGGWSGIDKVHWPEMESSVGVGLRLGMSKSVQGVVNYLDLSWPLNGPLADGWRGARLTLQAYSSL